MPHIEEGVKDEHFAVWIRLAATSFVKKRYGTIREDLQENETLTISIDANFPMDRGQKILLLSEWNELGGENKGMWTFLLYSGLVCYVATLTVLFQHYLCPRRPGQQRGSSVVEEQYS